MCSLSLSPHHFSLPTSRPAAIVSPFYSLSLQSLRKASSLGDSITDYARLGPLGSHHSSVHFLKQPS